jgi:hypothetical protein
MRIAVVAAILPGMRNRLLLPLALTALSVGLLALPAVTAAIKIPKGVKAPKVTGYPATIDAVGYLDYRWTYDTTGPCHPGQAETIDESLGFELGSPRPTKVGIIDGKVVIPPAIGGDATVQTELVSWKTSNWCPPTEPAKDPPEPVCKKKLRAKLAVAVGPVIDKTESGELAPLAHQTQVSVGRITRAVQDPSCTVHRPKIVSEAESSKGWFADPYAGAVVPLKASDWQFRGLRVGETLKRTVEISGGCGKASFKASASASIPSTIRSCVVKGKVVVMIKRTGKGFEA